MKIKKFCMRIEILLFSKKSAKCFSSSWTIFIFWTIAVKDQPTLWTKLDKWSLIHNATNSTFNVTEWMTIKLFSFSWSHPNSHKTKLISWICYYIVSILQKKICKKIHVHRNRDLQFWLNKRITIMIFFIQKYFYIMDSSLSFYKLLTSYCTYAV